ncbi:5'/3'-nucleotidase SurE [Selenomonas ruminantium]|uniref:5'/3'-nucleotidase SurE n=1 Tax=Selenomonas ruminantium TaxID=971 RepID=UPI000417AC83|nr:5'/3'-nucleotidase SurE [Selenomonas ruminantium]
MRILLSNDDGIKAAGIEALVRALHKEHEIIVSAPMKQQSGMSNALTIGTPIEVARDKMLEEKYGIEAWAVGGTPADSAKLYIEAFMTKDRPVDLVVSGINHGANLATDIIYSGTVGAAMEGYFHDIPSFALSLDTASKLTYDEAAEIFARDLAKLMPDAGKVFLYNVNFPLFLKDGLPQYVYGRQGKRDYLNAFTREERDGKVYYTMAGEVYDSDKGSATDIYATEQGYISITPLVADMTDYVALDQQLEK